MKGFSQQLFRVLDVEVRVVIEMFSLAVTRCDVDMKSAFLFSFVVHHRKSVVKIQTVGQTLQVDHRTTHEDVLQRLPEWIFILFHLGDVFTWMMGSEK